MAIRAASGIVELVLRNDPRDRATPPVVFPRLDDTDIANRYTYTIWVKLLNNIPAVLVIHRGIDGSQITLEHDGTNWLATCRISSTFISTFIITPITLNRWALIGISGVGRFINTAYGLQDVTSPETHPVTVVDTHSVPTIGTMNTAFDYLKINVGANYSVSCFKFFVGNILGPAPIQQLAQSFSPINIGGIVPMWNSTLRTPGDISNNTHPYASDFWEHGHGYSEINPPNNLIFDPDDPAYMATTPCPTWVYPIDAFQDVTIDPGLTPLVKTTYKAPKFYFFSDKGSLPLTDSPIANVVYYGVVYSGVDPGVPLSEAWGLYRDDADVEVATMGNPAYQFSGNEVGTVIPPGSLGVIKASTVYLWEFGGQFVWNPVTPQTTTTTARLGYLKLFVTYTGTPTGVAKVHTRVGNLSGLFAIQKGGVIDIYNRGLEMKIPDPTIKTAYIGE